MPVILGIDSCELFRLFMCFLDIHAYINLFVQSLCFQTLFNVSKKNAIKCSHSST